MLSNTSPASFFDPVFSFGASLDGSGFQPFINTVIMYFRRMLIESINIRTKTLGKNPRFEEIFSGKSVHIDSKLIFFRFKNFFLLIVLRVFHKPFRSSSKSREFLNSEAKKLPRFSTELSTGDRKFFPQFVQKSP